MESRALVRWLLVGWMLWLALLARAAAPIDQAHQDLWRRHAFTCPASAAWPAFPARRPADGDACDDGDETLFDGLMCASGMPEGCASVRAAQVPGGRWYRSPRRAAMAAHVCSDPHAPDDEKRRWCRNTFSPDMALGVQLWAHTTRDAAALARWVQWIDQNRPCELTVGEQCYFRGLPRFCTDDTEGGCTLRPGDYATLAATLEALDLVHFGTPEACPSAAHANLPLSDVFIRALCAVRPKVVDILLADAVLNKPGYSQHLVGVDIMVLRRARIEDLRIDAAALILNAKQPRNPFFAYLAGVPPSSVRTMTLALCPADEQQIPAAPDDWAWQREDAAEAWTHSVLWDCLFMASLLK